VDFRKTEPDVVVIGIHGFCGASIDYQSRQAPVGTSRAPDSMPTRLRGQGSDPIHARRGDIGDPKDWYRDLFAFTQLVREQHPDAKVVWFGESMGALIAAHAWREAPDGWPPATDWSCLRRLSGFATTSPRGRRVGANRGDHPAAGAGFAGHAFRRAGRPDDPEVGHGEQVKKNPYHVEQHTLRLIGALTRLIDGMNDCAASFQAPVLVLHGGQDFFNNDSDVRGFVASIPEGHR
jgi:pimeloyl-ACP methyl ester carboxylesterase